MPTPGLSQSRTGQLGLPHLLGRGPGGAWGKGRDRGELIFWPQSQQSHGAPWLRHWSQLPFPHLANFVPTYQTPRANSDLGSDETR